MSEPHDKHDAKDPKGVAVGTTSPATTKPGADALSQLMASGAPAAKAKPDLDKAALAAAEQALALGARALEAADKELGNGHAAPASGVPSSRTRELVLRGLIIANIVAMVVLVMLPAAKSEPVVAPHTTGHDTPAPAHDPVVQKPNSADPVLRAFALAETRDYRSAMTLLEQYLADQPRLDAGRKANVLLALEHYATQIGDFTKAQEFQRRTEALRSAHSMPEDLVQMALEAERNGDVESMRRNYARLLLQQKQIPSSLYRHVAEAYLKLGDSYRTEAERGESAAREKELEQVREALRRQATRDGNGNGGNGK
ncbi:MAG: hypothetical protein ABL997_05790 [Planctomycetota bacterium]